MSKTTTALIGKFIMTFILAAITFLFIDGNALRWIFIAALIATALNYLLGDLYVLPKFGNISASIGDGILGALTFYIIDLLVPAFEISLTALTLFGILVAVGEYFFHKYLLKSEKVEP